MKRVLLLSLMIGLLAAKPVLAQQDTNINPDTGQPAVNQPNQTIPGNPNTDITPGVSPWWIILPLLALAIFFLARQGTKEAEDEKYDDRRYAGSKGGGAKRNMDEMNP